MSSVTKKALAQSLKKIASKKEINRITINDITEECDMNRQTFYYHFKDIYDLLEWIYTNEVIERIDEIEKKESWQDGFLYVFEYMLQNKKFIYNTYYSVSRDFLLNFTYKQTNVLVTRVVDEISKGNEIKKEDKEFVINFYKYALVGMVQDWIIKGMTEEPKNIVDKLSIMLEGQINKNLEKLSN